MYFVSGNASVLVAKVTFGRGLLLQSPGLKMHNVTDQEAITMFSRRICYSANAIPFVMILHCIRKSQISSTKRGTFVLKFGVDHALPCRSRLLVLLRVLVLSTNQLVGTWPGFDNFPNVSFCQ